MKENYKKLTEDFKKDFVAILAKEATAKFFSIMKDVGDDTGTFDVIISTADRDRQNEIVMQEGWDLSFYKLNPVVLWAHDYDALPIGVCTNIALVDGKLRAQGKFAPASANPFAQQVRALYEGGFVKTTSVGFIPTEFDANDRDVVLKAQLLEFSFVPVPANPYALSLRQIKELNIDVPFLMTKGLQFDVKEKEGSVGDRCELDDGTPGVMGTDANGNLTCVPEKKETDYEDALKGLNKSIEVFKANYVRVHAAHNDNHMKAVEVFKDTIAEAVKDIDIAKSFSEKGVEVFKDIIEAHKKALGLENQRHSKELEEECLTVGKAIEVFKNSVKDYTDSHPEDTGENPTADSVRMMHAVKDAFSHIAHAHTALKEYADSEGGKEAGEKSGSAQGSKTSTKDFELSDVDSFVKNREFLRAISIALGQTLRKYNREDRVSK